MKQRLAKPPHSHPISAPTEILIHEHKDSGLRILRVCPPAVDTPLIAQAIDNGPQAVRDAAKNKSMVTPDSIIDAIEIGLEKGREVILPGQANFGYLLRRLSPALLWKLSDKMEKAR